ncbi:MAG: UDP-glucose 4-epimerase GalE [Candidatus Omnitrophica bacterium]|nr:UDP-glucose 4-epimerase GalE [Candidatus Omnitrophota bacterium]
MGLKKKIIVTGGAGYIGSHTVVELAQAGYEPVIIDNFCNSRRFVLERIKTILSRPVECYDCDCCQIDLLRKIFTAEGKIHGAIHFAAVKAVGESAHKPLLYYQNNLGSLTALLTVLQEAQVPYFVFSSSACVYGAAKSPVTEESPVQPATSPYGNTKQIGEEITADLVKSGAALKAISLRYFNPIGAHSSGLIGELPLGAPNNLVPFVTQTAAGLREKLTIFGNDYPTPDGTGIRDYLHVIDLARAHINALEYLEQSNAAPGYAVFNLGTGRGYSVLEIIKTFEQVNHLKLPVVIGSRRQGDVAVLFANPDKANRLLKWQTKLTIEEALRDAWLWQKSLAAQT